MECPVEHGKGIDLIVAYGLRTLDPETEILFEQHMALCSACRQVADAQRHVWSALDAWTPVPVSSDFDQKLFRRIAEEEQGAWWRRLLGANWSWRPAMPVAAACAALIAVVLLKSPWSQPATEMHVQPNLQIEQVQHALDDLEMLKLVDVETTADRAPAAEDL